jgi:hypothetical protein
MSQEGQKMKTMDLVFSVKDLLERTEKPWREPEKWYKNIFHILSPHERFLNENSRCLAFMDSFRIWAWGSGKRLKRSPAKASDATVSRGPHSKT